MRGGKRWGWFCFFLVFFGFYGCGRSAAMVDFEGKTMGTTWHIRCALPPSVKPETVQKLVEERLFEINGSMSAFMPTSTLSRFNDMKAGETLALDALFFRVLKVSSEMHRITGGAFDPTVMPLVNLWGFGPGGYAGGVPEKEALEDARRRVGFDKLILDEEGRLGKKEDGVRLDFGAIAKGYGVDVVAEALEELGLVHYLVEIGGEVRVSGCRPDGQPWRVGISRPEAGAGPSDIWMRLEMCKGALATSGDYRNFFESGGRRFSHVMDPVTGMPVDRGIISASVRHADCMVADALATAIMVMGMEAGQEMILGLDGVEALIIREGEEKGVESWVSPGFVEKAP